MKGCRFKPYEVCFMIILDYDIYHFISLSLAGFSISVVEEDSVQQLYITDVRAGGLAFAKGSLARFILFLFSPLSLGLFWSFSLSVCWASAKESSCISNCCDICAVLLVLCNILSALWGFWEPKIADLFSTPLNSE